MDEELPLDTLELPYEPPDVQEEPEVGAAGRAKAVAKVPKPIPVDILLRASCPLRQNSDIEQFVNNVASHYDVSDDVQAPGVPVDDLRVGMKRAAMNISRSEFEIFTFGTKYDLPEAAIDELLEIVSNVRSLFIWTQHLNYSHTVFSGWL